MGLTVQGVERACSILSEECIKMLLIWFVGALTAVEYGSSTNSNCTKMKQNVNAMINSGSGNAIISSGKGNAMINSGSGNAMINSGGGNIMINSGSGIQNSDSGSAGAPSVDSCKDTPVEDLERCLSDATQRPELIDKCFDLWGKALLNGMDSKVIGTTGKDNGSAHVKDPLEECFYGVLDTATADQCCFVIEDLSKEDMETLFALEIVDILGSDYESSATRAEGIEGTLQFVYFIHFLLWINS